jgi:hypothetical protein
MKLVLSSGDTREIPAGGATIGYCVDRIEFTSNDLRKMLEMEDAQLRFWLATLITRFGPIA